MLHRLTVPLLALGLIGTTGCATIVLPQGPDLTRLGPLPDAPTVVVPKPADAREKPRRAGSIGLAGLSLKDDPSNLIAREAIVALHSRRLNGDLIPVAADDLPRQLEEAKRRQAHATLVITIKEISVKSFDALLDAVAHGEAPRKPSATDQTSPADASADYTETRTRRGTSEDASG